MERTPDIPFTDWLSALEQRHLADLRFSEVRRGIEALSLRYVERRGQGGASAPRAVLDGRAKRAAFALYYGSLHFLVVRHVVEALGLAELRLERIVDLGCGSGSSTAAWALGAVARRPRLSGVDAHAWAAAEARWTWRFFALAGTVRVGDLRAVRLPGKGSGVLAAWVVNELPLATRDDLLARLLGSARAGAAILVVEPIARRGAQWWEDWAAAVTAAGGRADEWRIRVALPDLVARLDRAAGLDHRELTARTLCLRPV